MRTRRFTLLAVLVIGVAPVSAEVVTSEFNSDPLAEGWNLIQQFCDPIVWIDKGLYNQQLNDDACPGGKEGAQDTWTRTTDFLNGNPDWFYEFLVFTTGDRTEFAGAAPTVVVAGNAFGISYNATVASDQVEFFRDAGLPILFFDLQPGVFHRIRLELRNDPPPTYKWFIDSVLVDEGLAEGPFPANDARIGFRGLSWHLPTFNQWDYIRFGDIPIPASGDFDSSGAADSFEIFYFQECLDRSEAGETANPSCSWADMNADNTVDCTDAGLFAAIYAGDPADVNFFQCNPPIPAVSDWGVAVMALLLVTMGTVAIRPMRASA